MPEIRNPNLESQGSGGGGTGGGDFRSLILFTFLALAALMVYQYFQKPAANTPANQAQQTQSQAQQAQSSAPPAPAEIGATGSKNLAASAAAATVAAPSESKTIVENEKFRITFTNKGAQVQHWILKHYTDSTGKPLDMVQQQTAESFGLPLSLYTYDNALTAQLNSALYQPSTTGPVVAPGSVSFHYAANGLDVVKTFSFDSTYAIGVHVNVKRNGEPVRALVTWPAGLGDMEEFTAKTGRFSGTTVVPTQSMFGWSIDGKQDTEAAKKVSGNATFDQPYEYAAIMDLYFAAAMLPDVPSRATLVTFHHSIDLPSDLNDPNSAKKPAEVIGLAMGDQSGDTQLRLYAGPKETDILNSIHAIGADGKPTGESLASMIQYGWWGIIAKPLYLALRALHSMLGPGINNWGWAIIIITVVFNVVLLPTRIWTMKSSLKMMRIQPRLDGIKKKYANLKINDPKRAEMQAEQMAIMKEEGVNMYGGCLPLLLQMPLFFAYYRVLLNAVELRQAHWFWLTDLSMPDPLHVLPILIIGTMFFVQFITPSPGMDPAQRRMMAIMMPAIMGFTLWHFASGLALYWITGNIINLIMQVAINRSKIGKEMHEIAARRAAKKLPKGGNTTQRVIQGRR
ncbi:membrane protein insertase YidC [Telmatobacter sp. DSM 110680]|uniref:Membrane protein insertase YidC n=1 Tax=Telmatobacter sp. DSM 110680 TaxID=3036704 RepID=A0AAU7DIQ1_9BACT